MGWVLRSDRDIGRIEVLTEVLSGRRTIASVAIILAITARQVSRTLIRFREDGGGGLIHKGRGQSSNDSASAGVREYVLELVKSKYADFGPTSATEVLPAKHDIRAGRETLRTWMLEEGLWQSRKQRRSFHQPRLRREGYGELIQIDGSDHQWFGQRGEPCTLLVFIDDATSKLMQLRFVPSESTTSYFEALNEYLTTQGCPTAFLSAFMKQYTEKFSIPAAKAENLHRTPNVQASRLADILCHREQRHVSQQLSLVYDRRQIILEGAAGQPARVLALDEAEDLPVFGHGD